MRRHLIIVIGLGLAASACAGPSVLISGESVMPPETPPPVLPLVVLAGDDLTPLAAEIVIDGAARRADVTGRASVVWEEAWDDRVVQVEISAAGFHQEVFAIDGVPDELPLEVRLEPVVLTGSVTTEPGVPIDGVSVELNGMVTVTDPDGDFRFQRATPGDLTATRPAWATTVANWTGQAPEVELVLVPRQERALRVNPAKVADGIEWARLLALADRTEVTGFVLDTKDQRGTVHYTTAVEAARELDVVVPSYDITQALADMEEHNLYKIARISAFQDDPMARLHQELAVSDAETGRLWQTREGKAWLDPTNPASWEYPLALATEACALGFDEIQFDDARFPTGGTISTMRYFDPVFDGLTTDAYFEEELQTARVSTIAAFLGEARRRLNPAGCAVAANVFSITFHSRSDEGIGQLPGPLSHAADVLSPMIYSYNYQPGYNEYEDPNEHAPQIVGQVLDTGLSRVEGLTIVRPWVQRAFIEPADILAVQSAATNRGLGWMLWSESSSYDSSFLSPAR
jgi:hypothetical protein